MSFMRPTGHLLRNVVSYCSKQQLNCSSNGSLINKIPSRNVQIYKGSGKDWLPTLHVAVTGAAGQIAYSLLPRIANGEMLGSDQPIVLHLVEVPQALNKLEGVVMELQDCAFPLLQGVVATDDLRKGFADVSVALLVGAKPRSQGMERKDLLSANASIFAEQGKALNQVAADNLRVFVVGNPANTNALICAANAPKFNPERFMSMMRLDQNRTQYMIAEKVDCKIPQVDRVVVWGNHSSTQYPDISHARIRGESARKVINDDKWIRQVMIPKVQQRGAEVIKARGASSAASAAAAVVDHMRDYWHGVGDRWCSMGIISDGSYGIDEGLWYSVPVTCPGGHYNRILNLPIDEFSAEMMEKTRKELIEERDAVRSLIPKEFGDKIVSR
eukprot:jgi/Galph1/4354/GphlegSOOS_G2972.1